MRQVDKDKSGNALTVEVSITDTKYKFPVGHATRKADNGKEYYILPVTYSELEEGDINGIPKETLDELSSAVDGGVEDVLKAMNAGLRLAQGDALKQVYYVKQGKDLLVKAFQWMVTMPEVLTAYSGIADTEAKTRYLLERYRAQL